jgi:hypothetical protein
MIGDHQSTPDNGRAFFFLQAEERCLIAAVSLRLADRWN